MTPRLCDVIVSFGERIAAMIIAEITMLRYPEIKCESVDLLDVLGTDTRRFDPKDLGDEFFAFAIEQIRERIGTVVREGKIPVITGFFGRVPGSLIATHGRGYSDLTAGLVAAAARADYLVIWKDVEGVFTADPNKIPGARLIKAMTPEEAVEITHYGSEVIHPFTIRQVAEKGIPLQIRCIHNLGSSGTTIAKSQAQSLGPSVVTIKEGICVVSLTCTKNIRVFDFMAKVFATLQIHRIPMDLVSTSRVSISVAMPKPERLVLNRLLSDLEKIGKVGWHLVVGCIHGQVNFCDELAILSLVGQGMRQLVGTSGRLFSLLGNAGVNIEMISQGASEINISCVINSSDSQRALEAAHNGLLV